MLDLTLGEKIMIYRVRKGLKLNELGQLAFNELSASHMKIKKIEAGILIPKEPELKKIADVLEVSLNDLCDSSDRVLTQDQRLSYNDKVEKMFPKIQTYIDLVNTGCDLGREFVVDTFKKMVDDFSKSK